MADTNKDSLNVFNLLTDPETKADYEGRMDMGEYADPIVFVRYNAATGRTGVATNAPNAQFAALALLGVCKALLSGEAKGFDNVVYNDRPGRAQVEVVALSDRAIASQT
jgi:hypothetical protein